MRRRSSTSSSPVGTRSSAKQRRTFDDRIKKNIESLDGVGEVRFVGERQRQIQVWLNGEKLYSYNLNIDQVRAALAAQNVEIPGGRVSQGSPRALASHLRPRRATRGFRAHHRRERWRLTGSHQRYRPGGGRRRRAAVTGAPRWNARGGAGSAETVRHQHPRGDQHGEGAGGGDPERSAPRLPLSGRATIQVHRGVLQRRAGAPGAGRVSRRADRAAVYAQLALHADRGGRHPHLHHLHLHPDAGVGFTLNQITMLALALVVGIVIDDAIVVLENIFKFAEEKSRARGSGDRGHPRHRLGGARHHPQPRDHFPAGGLGGIVGASCRASATPRRSPSPCRCSSASPSLRCSARAF